MVSWEKQKFLIFKNWKFNWKELWLYIGISGYFKIDYQRLKQVLFTFFSRIENQRWKPKYQKNLFSPGSF
jgi:hypothetical protein